MEILASTYGIGHVHVAESKKHLREIAFGEYAGTHSLYDPQFDEIPANINTRENVFVLVDEAHELPVAT